MELNHTSKERNNEIKSDFAFRIIVNHLLLITTPMVDSETFSPLNLFFIQLIIEEEEKEEEEEETKKHIISKLKSIVNYLKQLSAEKDYQTIDRNKDIFINLYKKVYEIDSNTETYLFNYKRTKGDEKRHERIEKITDLCNLFISEITTIGDYFEIKEESETDNYKDKNFYITKKGENVFEFYLTEIKKDLEVQQTDISYIFRKFELNNKLMKNKITQSIFKSWVKTKGIKFNMGKIHTVENITHTSYRDKCFKTAMEKAK